MNKFKYDTMSLLKEKSTQKGYAILNNYEQNTRTTKLIKETLLQFKPHNGSTHTPMLGGINNLMSTIDKSSRLKLNKDT